MSTVHYSPGVRVVPGPGTKQFDLTHADTNEHSAALPAGFPAGTSMLYCRPSRIAGTGTFGPVMVSGGNRLTVANGQPFWWIRAVDGLFYYSLSVINDDWDIYVHGYVSGGGVS